MGFSPPRAFVICRCSPQEYGELMQTNFERQYRERPQLAPPTDYGPLVLECARRGIGRTLAYELMNRNLIETFTIGNKRMVKIPSLTSLPDRLQQPPVNDG